MVLTNDNEESRRMIESCYKRSKTLINPIIDWEDDDVWNFIRANKIPYCSLYDEGFRRLGCIGCPLSALQNRQMEFARYPKYKSAYLLAFEKMLERRKARNMDSDRKWQDARPIDIYNWWLDNGVLKGQLNLFEDVELDE